MGLDHSAVQFLQACHRDGVDFTHTMTLGRQSLYLSPWQARTLSLPEDVIAEAFCDGFLRSLGAADLIAVDASDFEGADLVHDLNQPLPDDLIGRFSAVIDSGTLEHVFDVPSALRSVLAAVRPGGHFVSINPTNNECGHGFYQFSPELWFRVLSPENGFELETMLMREMHPGGRWYRVSDPAELGGRVGFRSHQATYLFVRARRTEGDILATNPQQSDYVMRWEGRTTASRSARSLSLEERLRKSARIRAARLATRYRRLRGRDIEDPFVRVQFAEHVKHFHPIDRP